MRFGNSLYKEEDYYRAITEYKRFLHFFPHHPKATQVTFQIGFSYLKGKKWDAALPYFQKLSLSQTHVKEEASFAIAQTYFLSENRSSAIKEWSQFLEIFPKSSWADPSFYQKGWAYFLQEKNKEAQQELSQIKNTKLKMKAELLSQEINHWDTLPTRSPFLAGLFSAILPGSGQWVDGRFWDGAAALTINGMFAYGIYATLDKEYYVPAGILIFFGAGFYGANIFSAVSSAHKFNRAVKDNQWQRLKAKYGLDIDWNGYSLTVRF
ncbi:MAG: tetratricopeptide repeat protein [Deltaproteobacteria bacterium]|nr:tetratricopeptide repeat protein [Deltaproteobacteria bacterium]